MQYEHLENNTTRFIFDHNDHWTITDKVAVTVRVFDTLHEIVAEFFDKSVEWLADNMDEVSPSNDKSVREILHDAAQFPSWGWCTQGFTGTYLIRLWYSKDYDYEILVKDVLEMLAHEQGHMHGKPLPNHAKEEERAQAYGRIAVLAAKMADAIVADRAYAAVRTEALLESLQASVRLIVQDLEIGVGLHSDSAMNVLRELRRRVGVA